MRTINEDMARDLSHEDLADREEAGKNSDYLSFSFSSKHDDYYSFRGISDRLW